MKSSTSVTPSAFKSVGQATTPDGKSEKYVAHNPIEGEFTHPDLYLVAKKIKKRIF